MFIIIIICFYIKDIIVIVSLQVNCIIQRLLFVQEITKGKDELQHIHGFLRTTNIFSLNDYTESDTNKAKMIQHKQLASYTVSSSIRLPIALGCKLFHKLGLMDERRAPVFP